VVEDEVRAAATGRKEADRLLKERGSSFNGYFGSVERTGIEPATPWLQTRCSPS
jgi:hypothetical protein